MKPNKPTTPRLRFPEFDGSWKAQTVKQVLEKCSLPVDVKAKTEYFQIGLRSHGKGIFHKNAVSGESLGEKRVFWVQPNCLVLNIIFAWEQAVGTTTENESGMVASHRFPMYAGTNGAADVDFMLLFFLRKQGKYLLGLASPGGAGRNRTLGQSEFDKLKLTIPTLLEQQKIAAFLKAVDKRVQQLIERKALLEEYKKGVMQRLFTQAIRFKDDRGNDFPMWEEKQLGAVCEIVGGLTYSPEDVVESGLLVLRSSNIQDGRIEFKDNVFVNSKVAEWNMSRPDDILICVRNGSKNLIGKNAIITEGGPPATHGAFMTVLRGKQNRFLFQLLQTDNYKRNVHINLGATINSINGSDLKKFKFMFPSTHEQTKIATFLTAIDHKIESVAAQVTLTQTFRRGLLQQMFV